MNGQSEQPLALPDAAKSPGLEVSLTMTSDGEQHDRLQSNNLAEQQDQQIAQQEPGLQQHDSFASAQAAPAGLQEGAEQELRGLARLEENALEAKVSGPIGVYSCL